MRVSLAVFFSTRLCTFGCIASLPVEDHSRYEVCWSFDSVHLERPLRKRVASYFHTAFDDKVQNDVASSFLQNIPYSFSII